MTDTLQKLKKLQLTINLNAKLHNNLMRALPIVVYGLLYLNPCREMKIVAVVFSFLLFMELLEDFLEVVSNKWVRQLTKEVISKISKEEKGTAPPVHEHTQECKHDHKVDPSHN